MIPPAVSDLDANAVHFWVEETPSDLIDTVTTKLMMEELMEM